MFNTCSISSEVEERFFLTRCTPVITCTPAASLLHLLEVLRRVSVVSGEARSQHYGK